MLGLLVATVLTTSGVSAGVLVGTVLGGMPLLRTLPLERYVHAHGFFATRYDPFMPICLVVTAVGDVVLAVVAPVLAAAVLFGAGAVGAAAVSVISLLRNAPVNRRMAAMDPENLPADFVDPRDDWCRWNTVRTACGVAALLLTAAGAAVLVGTS
ncbi:anthrone oxygenase family protein [Amycolatopsis arida]|uniref:anthrone oxygenase family protein n=1 Tax=Amycolatopsis arida TaxID=587909 RepID=UPI000B8A2940|nr:anthrone oxygenase family protein [Amycolatopsis arida]